MLEKEKLKMVKNQMHALKVVHGKKSIKGVTEILSGPKNGNASASADNNEQEMKKQAVKKRERKALDKSFQLA